VRVANRPPMDERRRPRLLASAFFLTFFILVSTKAPAAEVVDVGAVLDDPTRLLSWVTGHHGEAWAAEARVGQAEADVAQSRVYPNPSLLASLGDWTVGGTNPPGLGFADTAIWSVGVTETIELAKRGPRLASAQARLEAAHYSYRDTLARLAADARMVLARLVFLEARQGALEESLAAARQALELQRVRLERGDLSGTDYDRLYLDALGLEADVATNRSDLEAARADCVAVMAATCDVENASLDRLDAGTAVPPAEIDAALRERPDLRALEAGEESAREDSILAHRRKVPDPALGVSYTRDKLVISGDQPRQLGVSLSFGLPVFDRGRHDAARADLRAAELQATREVATRRARATIAGLLERRETLARTLASLRDDAVPRSRGVLASTLGAVDQGELSMTDLLLARRSHTDLVLKLMQTELDAFAVGSDLRLALGIDAGLASPPSPSHP
jgi:cobalt-zinc-cadmium efflux system outer membrane protein